MTRPKDLTLESPPVDGDSVPVDSAGGGTRRSLVAELRDATKLRGVAVSATAPSSGQALVYDAGAAAYAPTDVPTGAGAAVVSGIDDFVEPITVAWTSTLTSGGTVEAAGAAPVDGYGGPGLVRLQVTDAGGSRAQIWRWITGFWSSANPVLTWRVCKPFDTDDHHTRIVGLADQDASEIVAWAAVWTGAATVHYLVIQRAGVADLTAFTLPTLGGAAAYIVRLSMTPTGAVLELAPEGSPLAVVATRTLAPTATPYAPYVSLEGSGVPAGQVRSAGADYVAWRAERV